MLPSPKVWRSASQINSSRPPDTRSAPKGEGKGVRPCFLTAMGGLDPLTCLRRFRVKECQPSTVAALRVCCCQAWHVPVHLRVIAKSEKTGPWDLGSRVSTVSRTDVRHIRSQLSGDPTNLRCSKPGCDSDRKSTRL